MTYHIQIAKVARLDMKHAVDYIKFSLNNRQAARDLLRITNETFQSLTHMPYRYQLADDIVLASWGIRFVQVKNYLAFYTVSAETATVHIIRFLYGKSDWAHILRRSYIPET